VKYDFPRRSIYLPVVRNAMYELFDLFDYGDAQTPQAKRNQTIIAPQSLYFMNSDLVTGAAGHLAARAGSIGSNEVEPRIRKIYELVFCRAPTADEVAQGSEFIAKFDKLLSGKHSDRAERGRLAWQSYCQTILVSNAFLTVE